MQNWLKSSLLFIVFTVLCSCQGEEEHQETQPPSPQEDSTDVIGFESTPNVDTLEIVRTDSLRVFIDATNHEKFLNKNGTYEINWDLLADAKIESVYFPEHEAEGFYAEFGKSPSFLRGMSVKISGYVIPFDINENGRKFKRYVLSLYPNSGCFFCGGGGPESVMEIFLKTGQRDIRMDEYLTFRGRLVLNNGNPMMLSYLLYDVEILEDEL